MSAVISECGKYRYRLERANLAPLPDCIIDFDKDILHPLCGKVVAFFGINPSTADAALDDSTVRKWAGFCRRWGVPRYIVGNVFSYRATNVKELTKIPFQQGPEHLTHLMQVIADADVLVPCWGSRSKVPQNLRNQLDSLMATLVRSGKPVMHFGKTESGDPKHPLMLGYNTQLIPWEQSE